MLIKRFAITFLKLLFLTQSFRGLERIALRKFPNLWRFQKQIVHLLLQTSTVPEVIVMGQPVINSSEWAKKKSREISGRKQNLSRYLPAATGGKSNTNNLGKQSGCFDVSVIVSIYKPGNLLDLFLGNLREQSIFDSAEIVLIIVNPNPPEIEIIKSFVNENNNVVFEIVESRITIYEAWNRAIEKSSAPLITNMNIDDLRSPNSLQVQVNFMQSHSWVDVGYQDFFYLLDRDLDWTSIVKIGALSDSPPVTMTELAWFGMNPPHNGPIWRRDLHTKAGLFNGNFRSAGDYEFWMRVVAHGGIFAKMSESTVGYYINPDGMSTSVESPSTQEERHLQREYRSMIKLNSVTIPDINLDHSYVSHPWDGAEVLTEMVLDKLKEVD